MTDQIRKVLTTMSGSYMNRWRLDSQQEAAWYDGLKGFPPEVLRRATIDARVDFPEWPPTLMEFRRYCVAAKRGDSDSTDQGILDGYNEWAKKHGQEQKKPNESLEEFRRRLVWVHECRRHRDIDGERRSLTSEELSRVVDENRKANEKIRWVK